jgi:tetratricopeptide (TPR) repeat protein
MIVFPAIQIVGCCVFCLRASLAVGAFGSSEEERFVAELLASKSEVVRKALLFTRKELVTDKTEKAVTAEAERLFDQGRNPEALSAYRLAHQIAGQVGDKDGVARIARGVGDIECAQGKYSLALESYSRSLKLGEELEDKEMMALALKSIRSTLVWQGEYKKAFGYYQKSLKLGEACRSSKIIALALNGIGLRRHISKPEHAGEQDPVTRL